MGKNPAKKKKQQQKSSPAKKTEQPPLQEKVVKSAKIAVKDAIKSEYQAFQSRLDPQKVNLWKTELKNFTRKGSRALIAILSITAILLVIDLYSHGRVMPGVKVGTVNIGYLKQADARQKLRNEVTAHFQEPMAFTYEGFTVKINPADMGLHLDSDRTGKRIPIFNFGKNNALTLMTSLLGGGHKESVHYMLDGDRAVSLLEQTLHLAEKRAKSAQLAWEGKELIILPESEGIVINRKKLIGDIRNSLENPQDENSPIQIEVLRESPQVAAADMEKEKERLVGLLEKSVTLQYEDEKLNFRPMDHLESVSFAINTTMPFFLKEEIPIANAQSEQAPAVNSNIQITLNEKNLEPYLQENLLKDIEIPTSPATINYGEDGKITINGKGENGKSVPRQKLKEALEIAINNGVSKVQIPVHVDHAPLTISDELKDMGIKELLATGHSAYYGSPPNRMFNIDHGTQKYNGLLVPPGEEFSFNEILGEVDGASGFKPEKVIKGNKIEVEYGGGICQVSTTMYRAALQAGLPITERKPHSWKVSYYSQSMGDGLDATIYPGVVDLKFLNDTKGYILIQAYTDGPELYFKIYGTDDGRTTELEGPFGGGLNYRWNRIVTRNGENTKEEIWSNYKPIPPPDPLPVQQ